MRCAFFNVLALTALLDNLLNCLSHLSLSLLYFFLFAMVFAGPLRVLALVFVRCPLTGRPFL